MRVLVIGGGVFVGRYLVHEALSREWAVTVVTRGRRALPESHAPATHVIADRRHDLRAVRGEWDVVIDTCGYHPRDVRISTKELAGRVGCYLFVSSASVYPDDLEIATEDADLSPPEDPESMDSVRDAHYGPLKLACEQIVGRSGIPSLVLRPGLIVGPHDESDRFGYWPLRMAAGGHVLAPGRPSDLIQAVDVRDHATFAVDCAARQVTGVFNVASRPFTWARLLQACTTRHSATVIHWIDSRLLRLNGVAPWVELPLWSGVRPPPVLRTSNGESAGLTIRPIEETAADTLIWEASREGSFPRPTQLAPSKEKRLLELYAS